MRPELASIQHWIARQAEACDKSMSDILWGGLSFGEGTTTGTLKEKTLFLLLSLTIA